jgi:TctA family transporter
MNIDGEYVLWAKALRASLLAFLVSSFFASVAFEYFPYFLTAYTTALFLIARRQRALANKISAVEQNPSAFEESYEYGPKVEPAYSAG